MDFFSYLLKEFSCFDQVNYACIYVKSSKIITDLNFVKRISISVRKVKNIKKIR